MRGSWAQLCKQCYSCHSPLLLQGVRVFHEVFAVDVSMDRMQADWWKDIVDNKRVILHS